MNGPRSGTRRRAPVITPEPSNVEAVTNNADGHTIALHRYGGHKMRLVAAIRAGARAAVRLFDGHPGDPREVLDLYRLQVHREVDVILDEELERHPTRIRRHLTGIPGGQP